MTRNQKFDLLTASIGKAVKITHAHGDTDLALVVTVDGEGFVFELANAAAGDSRTPYWTAFTAIADIQTPEA